MGGTGSPTLCLGLEDSKQGMCPAAHSPYNEGLVRVEGGVGAEAPSECLCVKTEAVCIEGLEACVRSRTRSCVHPRLGLEELVV